MRFVSCFNVRYSTIEIPEGRLSRGGLDAISSCNRKEIVYNLARPPAAAVSRKPTEFREPERQINQVGPTPNPDNVGLLIRYDAAPVRNSDRNGIIAVRQHGD
jgi:hypothetical protein